MDRSVRSGAPIVSDDATLRHILRDTRTIALIGASPHRWRDSHMIMAFLQRQGFRVFPVNPNAVGTTILGEAVHADLTSLPGPVEMVNVFRNSAAAGDAVDAAIAAKDTLSVHTVWLQLGVSNAAAATRAAAAGLVVVMDRCIKIEYFRLGLSQID